MSRAHIHYLYVVCVLSLGVACANAGEDALDIPALAAVADLCDGSVGTFEWSEVPGAEGYELEYGMAGSVPSVVTIDSNVTSYTPAQPLAPGEWSARVRAVAGATISEYSDALGFVVKSLPMAMADNDGPACPGSPVQLMAADVVGASYEWTGPNGFSSNEQNPVLVTLDAAAEGSYSVVVTVGECRSVAATTLIAAVPEQLYQQASSAAFDGNVNTDVITAGDQITLADNLDLGDGSDGVFSPVANTTLSGSYQFASVNIPVGITVRADGLQPLIIRSMGPVIIDGVLDASGGAGGDGVTFSTFGAGGVGVAGGSDGGHGTFSDNAGPLDGSPGAGLGAGANGSGWSGGGGGGYAVAGADAGPGLGLGGAPYGSADLADLFGGSGGGGGSGGFNCGSGGGGAGGGAILISAASITVNGDILALGGDGGSDGTGNCGAGGGGAGGAVYLRATDMIVNGTLSALGGVGGASTIGGSPYYGVGAAGAEGRVRLDFATLTQPGVVAPGVGFNGPLLASLGTSVATVTPTTLCSWGELAYTADEPGTSSVRFDVLDPQGNVLIAGAPSGTDLSALTEYSLQFRAMLTTADQTPTLTEWRVTYVGTSSITP